MSSIRTLKRRIKSIKSINEITKAMEMIAAVRFKRVEGRLRKSLPYTEALTELISRIVSEESVAAHPLFQDKPGAPELLVVLSGDRGLCGSFNTTLLRRAEQYVQEAGPGIEVFAIGKIGAGYAKRRGWKVWDSLVDIGFKFTPESLSELITKLTAAFTSGRYGKIQFLLMEMSRGGMQRPVIVPFVNLRYLFDNRPATGKSETEYIFEPDRATTLVALIDLYVKQRVFITLLKSVAAEYSARMVAMKLATDNGKDLIKELTLERNKIRQAMITKEISEIIGGVAALQ